jgi:hypothetical protein
VLLIAQMAFATPGAELWIRRYDGPGTSREFAKDIAASPDGSMVYVTGASGASRTGWDYATVAYASSTGATRWVSRYDGFGTTFDIDQAHALAVSPDGSAVFVTGVSTDAPGFYDYATVAYDARTGDQLWVGRYRSGEMDDAASDVAVSPDGSTVFVTGTSNGFGTLADYATVAYDASSGGRLWVRRYARPGLSFDSAAALGVSPGGSEVFVTGTSTVPHVGTDFVTLAYNASNGKKLWRRRFDRGSLDEASALGVSPDGSEVFVAGRAGGPYGRDLDFATVAYGAASGITDWVARYDGPAHGGDAADALAVSPDGSAVFVTGDSLRTRLNDMYATVAYSASTGAMLWVRQYDGPREQTIDEARAIGISPDGSEVFVTGISGPIADASSATLAYAAATGARLWLRLHEDIGPVLSGQGITYPVALATTSNGAFVTGSTIGSTTRLDYVTVAYSSS